jgi:hypothetical protein
MKPTKLKTIIIAFILIVLNSEIAAQYTLLRKGEKCPYDTAVATKIDVWRLESAKLTKADSLINQQNREIDSLKTFIISSEKIFAHQHQMYNLCLDNNEAKSRTIADLNKNFENLLAVCNKPKSWFERNKFAVGLITGLSSSFIILILAK